MSRKKPVRTQRRRDNVQESLIEAKTHRQSDLIKCLNKDELVICDGPAGTGKTYVAAGVACEHLLNKKISKIVISRSTQQCGDSGYLPGSIKEKLMPFMNPILSKLEYFLGAEIYKKMLTDETIEIYPLETMRGETLDDAFMILTEFQNATYEQIMMFATRIGKNTKCVLEGDLMQIDNRKSGGKRFHDEQKYSEGKDEGVSFVYFTEDDIVRSGIVKTIIRNARQAYKQ
jgi:phosphate starvation-inducible PhoH-like protein